MQIGWPSNWILISLQFSVAKCIFSFFFIHAMLTPETADKQCLKEGETGKEKDNCSDSASLRRAAGLLLAKPVFPYGARGGGRGGRGGALPYRRYIGTCRGIGYGFWRFSILK